MQALDLIRRKRDGAALDREQIEYFVRTVTDGTLPDYQASALLMAIVLRGMTPEETAWLTDAMVRSGIRMDTPMSLASRSTNTVPAASGTRRH